MEEPLALRYLKDVLGKRRAHLHVAVNVLGLNLVGRGCIAALGAEMAAAVGVDHERPAGGHQVRIGVVQFKHRRGLGLGAKRTRGH